MDVRNLEGKTALVTGAASGIGKETALAFARRGADLFLCDLNEAGLKQTAHEIEALGRRAVVRHVDVAQRDEVRAFADAVHGEVEAVDILMNNAGVGLGGGFLDTTLEDWDWIVGINLMGVIHGLHFFLPKMVARAEGGHVVNVSSAAGYVSSEAMPAYCTVKFGVLGLSESIAGECRPHGIGVTAVCPGLINTPIVQSSEMRGPAATPETRQRMADLYEWRGYGPDRVARNILKAIQRNRLVAPISPESWVFYYLKRLSPGLLRWMNRKVGERLMQQGGRS